MEKEANLPADDAKKTQLLEKVKELNKTAREKAAELANELKNRQSRKRNRDDNTEDKETPNQKRQKGTNPQNEILSRIVERLEQVCLNSNTNPNPNLNPNKIIRPSLRGTKTHNNNPNPKYTLSVFSVV